MPLHFISVSHLQLLKGGDFINYIVNADAIAFQLNAKWLMVKLPSGCAIAATLAKTTTKIVATNKVAVARRRLSLVISDVSCP